jgi:hypothetical protein
MDLKEFYFQNIDDKEYYAMFRETIENTDVDYEFIVYDAKVANYEVERSKV